MKHHGDNRLATEFEWITPRDYHEIGKQWAIIKHGMPWERLVSQQGRVMFASYYVILCFQTTPNLKTT